VEGARVKGAKVGQEIEEKMVQIAALRCGTALCSMCICIYVYINDLKKIGAKWARR
jgi:hypothetical protein